MKISIITPSYNQGKFVRDTFESILQQAAGIDLEYILVDAVSTDETPQLVAEYTPKFKAAGIDFKYICEPDHGQSDAINKGWRLATGDILAYLNSDDFYEPNVLARVVAYFQDHPEAQWLYGAWNLVNRAGKIYRTVRHEKYSWQQLLEFKSVGQPSCIFRRELLEKVGNLREDLHLAMDYELTIRFAKESSPALLPFVISNMRYYADAKSGNQTMKQMHEIYQVAIKYTKPWSLSRLRQKIYYLAGAVVILLHLDITRRIAYWS